MHLSAQQAEPGVWIGRNVVIHPTAVLKAPLFIGENSRIGAGARIGPNAVIGRDSVVDRHTSVTDSAVCAGSFCGEGLELDHVLIDRNRLVNLRLGAQVYISDSFILGSLRGTSLRRRVAHWIAQLVAAVLFLVTLPIVALVALLRFGQSNRRKIVVLPASPMPESWRTYSFLSFASKRNPADQKALSRIFVEILPNLLGIASGRLRLVGVAPRTADEVNQLPEDWRTLYLHSRAGLITESEVVHGVGATADEVYSSEAYYLAMTGIRHDFSLFLRFVLRALRNG